MLRRARQVRIRIHQVMDTGLFMLALWVAHMVRFHFTFGRPEIFEFEYFVWLWLVIIPAVPICLSWFGFYDRPMLFGRRQTAWMLVKSSAAITMICIIALFLAREERARAVIILFGFVGSGFLFCKELVMRWVYKTSYGMEQLQKRIILVGDPGDAKEFAERLSKLAPGNTKIVAELDINRHSPEDLMEALHRCSANTVVLHARHTMVGQVEKAVQVCELEGVETWLVADIFRTKSFRTSLDDFYGIPMVVLRSAPELTWQALIKQVLDYAGALVGIIVLSPLFVVLAILIKKGSTGAVLFRQQRCGLHGNPFVMLKFRTMVSDADQRKHELEALNEMSGPVFKITNDPRVTPIGRFLRKYSLDELPQLFNVLKGEMSLVGPRPLPVSEVQHFDDISHRRRLSVKPGLTCLWQISGRSDLTDFKEWVRLDLHYIDNWSIWLDIKIIFKTIPVVFQGKGAK